VFTACSHVSFALARAIICGFVERETFADQRPEQVAIDIHRYPAISDLMKRAKRRMPHFAWEYLASGTGADQAVDRNRAALDRVMMLPRAMQGAYAPETAVRFLGQDYAMPIGIAPIGGTSVIWPGAEKMLARIAAEARIPCGLSTVATQTPEDIGPLCNGMGWFQLYPLGADGAQEDLLVRAKTSGFSTLVLTVDVPINSRRERQRRAGFNVPPKMTPRLVAQSAIKPFWSMGVLQHGIPRARTLEQYAASKSVADVAERLSPKMRPNPDWSIIPHLRKLWDGRFIVKGICRADEAMRLREAGVDAIWVSNHGGRQLDAVPGAITILPKIRQALGDDFPLIYDSGVASGLDIARALALGADFVFAGRAFVYGAAAFGQDGVAHALRILEDDLKNVMGQVGTNQITGLRGQAFFE
jgi:L-lactate dehydrogenase (cytochrome)